VSEITPEKKIADLQVLLGITLAMQQEKDLTALLNQIMDDTCRIMDADRATIFLHDPQQDQLFSRVAKDAEISEIRIPSAAGIAGSVFTTGETINIPDAYQDERFNPAIDKKTGYTTHSILCMPLINNNGLTIGSIQVLNKRDAPFNDYDEELLSSVAIQSAMALENAMLIEHFVEKKQIQQSLQIAADIQGSLFPKKMPNNERLEFAAKNIPCDETGGDFYDFIEGFNGQLGLVIGDASGHGIPAAMLITTARAALRSYAAAKPNLEEVMAHVNKTIEADFADERFLTLFFGMLDTNTLDFTYSSGGHDSPLIFRNGDFVELDATGIPVGMMDDEEFPLEGPFQLQKGDIGVFCTDGVWEAMNADDEEYGRDRLIALIQENIHLTAEELIEAIEHSVFEFCGATPQRDDITLFVMKVIGEPGEPEREGGGFEVIVREEEAPRDGEVIYSNETLSGDLSDKDPLIEEVLELLEQKELADQRLCFGVRLALDEALVNAMRHGNKLQADKTAFISVRLCDDAFTILIEDQGEGFEPYNVPDPDDEESLYLERGRGVLLMKHYFDGVDYYNGGSQLLLTKHFT
jgi:serine phosphatase RsbU (regulator of sigma subunit)/anti-sigma regulatory factor (Ser/Thr protein kinase)